MELTFTPTQLSVFQNANFWDINAQLFLLMLSLAMEEKYSSENIFKTNNCKGKCNLYLDRYVSVLEKNLRNRSEITSAPCICSLWQVE